MNVFKDYSDFLRKYELVTIDSVSLFYKLQSNNKKNKKDIDNLFTKTECYVLRQNNVEGYDNLHNIKNNWKKTMEYNFMFNKSNILESGSNTKFLPQF